MNGTNERRIEVFAPFGEAYEMTKRILFEPFDFSKWLMIGFAAFLAGLADGTHGGGGLHFPSGDWNFKSHSYSHEMSVVQDQVAHWAIAVVIGIFLLIFFVVVPLFLWIGSRGRFMFIDCIVRNRGAIAEPWREFRELGNSFFLFNIAAFVLTLALMAILALPFFVPYFLHGEFAAFGIGWIGYVIAVLALWLPLGILWALAVWFMVPIMYLRRCKALAALWEVLDLIKREPLSFFLYALFIIVLVIAGLLASCLVTCLTCCIASIPYVGTVILLPLYTFYYCYTLFFLRQFGPEYEMWPTLTAATPPVTPPQGPPPLPA